MDIRVGIQKVLKELKSKKTKDRENEKVKLIPQQ